MTRQQAYIDIAQQLPNDEGILRRLERAKNDVLGFGYELGIIGIDGEGNRLYRVNKLSTSPSMLGADSTYETSRRSCSCPDYETARAGLCKHRLAVMIIERMEQE